MSKSRTKESATDRRIAFRGIDFIVTMQKRGWKDFYRYTPELSKSVGGKK